LEVNAIPGFTERSDLPKAAAKTGLSMSDLCVRIIESALDQGNKPRLCANAAAGSNTNDR